MNLMQELKRLVEKWRDPMGSLTDFQDGKEYGLQLCADELQSLIAKASVVDDGMVDRAYVWLIDNEIYIRDARVHEMLTFAITGDTKA